MSDEQSRSEEEREAARLERERKRAGGKGEPAPAPPRKDLPAQAPPIGAGPPRKAQPVAQPVTAADESTPQPPTKPPKVVKPPTKPPTPPRKVTDADETPSGTIRPGAATATPQPALGRRRSPGRHALLFAIVAVVLVAALFILNGIFEPFKGDGSESITV
jgi:hypothetical protein